MSIRQYLKYSIELTCIGETIPVRPSQICRIPKFALFLLTLYFCGLIRHKTADDRVRNLCAQGNLLVGVGIYTLDIEASGSY
jgi:hypothetical protein